MYTRDSHWRKKVLDIDSQKGDFPGSLVGKTLCSKYRGHRSTSGWGAKTLHAAWHGQKKKKSQKVQTSSYKIYNYQKCNVQHDKYD